MRQRCCPCILVLLFATLWIVVSPKSMSSVGDSEEEEEYYYVAGDGKIISSGLQKYSSKVKGAAAPTAWKYGTSTEKSSKTKQKLYFTIPSKSLQSNEEPHWYNGDSGQGGDAVSVVGNRNRQRPINHSAVSLLGLLSLLAMIQNVMTQIDASFKQSTQNQGQNNAFSTGISGGFGPPRPQPFRPTFRPSQTPQPQP